ncbi:MAG: ATP-binding cassette domain-containing protein, partial [Phycisphaerales bacterium]
MSSAQRDMAIELRGVSKTYAGFLGFGKRVNALRGIDVSVGRGEVFGLLGPNGAGKSTLVKILMTVIRPTSCAGHMLGAAVGSKAALRRVGYLPEHHKFPDHLTGAQVLDYFGALADVPRVDRRKRSAELLDLVGISRWKDHRVRGYSKGMRQRLGVANALMNDPDIVLLDEPTDGVDPVGRRDIRNILQEMKRRGKTVVLNSHLLSELEMVCDRVAILVQGLVSKQGTIDELTVAEQRYEIEVDVRDGEDVSGALSGVMIGPYPIDASEIGKPGLLESVTYEGSTLRVPTTDARRVQPIIDALRAKGTVIRAVRPVRPSLEDLFMQAVTDPNTGEVLKPGAAENPVRRLSEPTSAGDAVGSES